MSKADYLNEIGATQAERLAEDGISGNDVDWCNDCEQPLDECECDGE